MYKNLANTLFLAKAVISMPTCHSSNDTAQQLAQKADTVEGTVVICESQTAGKGQRGNTWEAEAGENLTLSVILRPRFLKVRHQFYLNMIASLAVRDCLQHFYALADYKVKWPNDVMCDQKKIAGILIENTINAHQLETAVMGIGLNVNQTSFKAPKATSLKMKCQTDTATEAVFERLIHALEYHYMRLKASKLTEIKADYLKFLFGYGELRKYITEFRFEGKIEDVTDEGRLVVSGPQGRKTYDLKEITFVY